MGPAEARQNFLRIYDNPLRETRVFFVRPDESGASGLTELLRRPGRGLPESRA